MPIPTKRTAPTIRAPGRKVAFKPTVTAATEPTPTHRAIARALELDCTPERTHLWVVLEHWLRTILYPGRAYGRLTGARFAIAARRAYWHHLHALDTPAYHHTISAGGLP